MGQGGCDGGHENLRRAGWICEKGETVSLQNEKERIDFTDGSGGLQQAACFFRGDR
jgi:hypothetical protein